VQEEEVVEEEEEVVEEEEEVVEEEEEVVEEEEEVLEEEPQEEEAVQDEEAQEEVEETQENEDIEAAPDADDDDDADMDDDLAAMEAAANAQWGAGPSEPEPAKTPERRRLPVVTAPPWLQAAPHSASKGLEKGAKSGCFKGKAKGKEKGAAKGTAMGKGDGKAKGLAKGKDKGAGKGMAMKRPLSPTALAEGAPPAKRPVAQSPGMGGAAAQTSAGGAAAGAVKVKLKRVVAEKLEMLKGKGIKLGASAVQALALAEPRDAQILIAALAKKSGEIANPTRWVEVSLERRANTAPAAATDGQQSAKAPAVKAVVAKTAVAKAPVTKAPVAKSPVAKAPAPQQASEVPKAPAASNLPAGVKVIKLPGKTVSASPQEPKAPIAKAPVVKAPIAKAPAAKAPIAKAPVSKAPGAKAGGQAAPPGIGIPPRLRTEQELEFFQMAVQAKLMTLNKQGIWKGPHPMDEGALVALLSIDSARALEILDEAEEQGKQLASPSRFVRDHCAEEEKV